MDQREADQKYYEQMLTLTGQPEWDVLVEELRKEIYQTQANLLENSQNWDQVCAAKGWCAALAYLINLRPRIKMQVQESENADV
jgi:hypothetical protein